MAVADLLTEELGYGKIEEYTSNFDFDKFQVSEKDKVSLQQKEQKLINAQNQVMRNLFEIAKNLYDSQQILANYGNGSFSLWFETIGYKKDYVYRMIDKYKLSLELNDKKAIDLPVKVVKELKNSDLDIETKLLILNSEKPLIAITKIKIDLINKDKSEIDKINEKIEYHLEMKLKYKRLMKQQDEEIVILREKLDELENN